MSEATVDGHAPACVRRGRGRGRGHRRTRSRQFCGARDVDEELGETGPTPASRPPPSHNCRHDGATTTPAADVRIRATDEAAAARPDRPGPYPCGRARPTPAPRSVVPARARGPRSATASYRAGMTRPSDAPDGWWLTLMWVADDEGVVSFRDVAPAGRPATRSAPGSARSRRWPGPCPGSSSRTPVGSSSASVALCRLTTRPARGAPRSPSVPPSGSSRRGPRRCGPTSWPRPSSPGSAGAVERLRRP